MMRWVLALGLLMGLSGCSALLNEEEQRGGIMVTGNTVQTGNGEVEAFYPETLADTAEFNRMVRWSAQQPRATTAWQKADKELVSLWDFSTYGAEGGRSSLGIWSWTERPIWVSLFEGSVVLSAESGVKLQPDAKGVERGFAMHFLIDSSSQKGVLSRWMAADGQTVTAQLSLENSELVFEHLQEGLKARTPIRLGSWATAELRFHKTQWQFLVNGAVVQFWARQANRPWVADAVVLGPLHPKDTTANQLRALVDYVQLQPMNSEILCQTVQNTQVCSSLMPWQKMAQEFHPILTPESRFDYAWGRTLRLDLNRLMMNEDSLRLRLRTPITSFWSLCDSSSKVWLLKASAKGSLDTTELRIYDTTGTLVGLKKEGDSAGVRKYERSVCYGTKGSSIEMLWDQSGSLNFQWVMNGYRDIVSLDWMTYNSLQLRVE